LILFTKFPLNQAWHLVFEATAGGDAKESAMPQGKGGSSERGFAAMDEKKQREIASKGGKASKGGGGNGGGGNGGGSGGGGRGGR
jgi:hypothetical protein